MDWSIREATIADYDALNALFAQIDRIHYLALPHTFRPVPGPPRERTYIEEVLCNPHARIFVTEEEHEIIGLAQADIRDSNRWPMAAPRS